ncbi:hypothetical protein BDZ89DRAFT_1130311 [Hymenopellis radicata]|nr:hypothetical protein BDZ89DRAFT_1130311 [Hymenopellis radicata]
MPLDGVIQWTPARTRIGRRRLFRLLPPASHAKWVFPAPSCVLHSFPAVVRFLLVIVALRVRPHSGSFPFWESTAASSAASGHHASDWDSLFHVPAFPEAALWLGWIVVGGLGSAGTASGSQIALIFCMRIVVGIGGYGLGLWPGGIACA